MTFVLLLATSNQGKLKELRRLLADLPVELLGLGDLPAGQLPAEPPVEDGDTFEANALKKAHHYAAASGLAVLSDDSGLEVDALGGAPGVHSARYAGEDASAADNNAKLAAAIAGLPAPERSARYRIVLAFLDPQSDAPPEIIQSACEGHVDPVPAGQGGFGYDPHFVPQGEQRHMAQLSADEKNRISHRGKAVRAFAQFLGHHLKP